MHSALQRCSQTAHRHGLPAQQIRHYTSTNYSSQSRQLKFLHAALLAEHGIHLTPANTDRIPAQAFNYRLGNRSALDWIIDQYRVKTDKRSGIVNDPNRAGDPQYIVRLLGKVISLSLETVQIVAALPALGVGEKESVAAGQHRQ